MSDEAHHRPLPAQVGGAEHAAPAMGDRAFHVALEREVDALRRDAAIAQRPHREAHHHLRPAQQGDRLPGVELRAGDQLRHHPDVARPVAARAVHRQTQLQLRLRGPAPELGAIEQLLGLAAAVEQQDPAEVSPASPSPPAGRAAAEPAPVRRRRSPGRRRRLRRPARSCRRDPGRRAGRPGAAAQIASVAEPTARTVCRSGSGSAGSPQIEIGTSPTAKA